MNAIKPLRFITPSIALAGMLLLSPVTSLWSQTVYANEYSGVIHSMDMRQCNLTYLCTSLMFGDIAWQTGNLYGIQGLSLYTIDLSTGSATLVGTAPQGISMPGMVGDGAGNLYMGDYSGNLQKFSIATGTFSIIGSVGTTCSGDLAKIGDTIYMIGAGLTLLKITLNPFSSTIIGTMNFGGTSPKAYGMVPSAWYDTLIVSVSYTGVNKLFKVNTNNASVTIFCDSLTAVPTQLFGMATDAEDANTYIPAGSQLGWQIFPNPAGENLQIIAPVHFNLECNILVCNINGEIFQVKAVTVAGCCRLDLADLPAGIYFLFITTRDDRKTFRFLVSK
jgi:hypothetical protein